MAKRVRCVTPTRPPRPRQRPQKAKPPAPEAQSLQPQVPDSYRYLGRFVPGFTP